MNPKDFAKITDAMDQLIEMSNAYRAKLDTQMADLPSPVRDEMVAQFHGMLMTQVNVKR